MISPAARDALALWLDHQRALRGAAANTLTAYMGDVTEFLAFITQHKGAPQGLGALSVVTTSDMRAWMAHARGHEVGARSLARKLSAVKSFYRWLSEREGFEPTAVLATRSPKFQRKLPRPLSVEAAKSVIETAELQSMTPWIAARDTAVLALLWIAAARLLSSPGQLAGATVVLAVVSLLLLSMSLWFQSMAASAVADADPVLQGSLQVATNLDMSVGLALAASILAIGVIITLWCGLLSRLRTAGGILTEATEALRLMPATVLALPPVLALAVVAVFAYWLLVALYVASAGTPHHGVLRYDESLRWSIWLHTLGVLWTVEVVLHLGFCATAGLMVRWYFGAAQAEGGVAGGGGVGLLCSTVWRILRYSFGSLALGALLIIPVRGPRAGAAAAPVELATFPPTRPGAGRSCPFFLPAPR
jgi:hypothetical protein